MNQEKEYIDRLKMEMENERNLQAEKRKQEREYLQKMLKENENQKARQKDLERRQRADDAKAQEEYSSMLDR